ncbi:hypothetical protein SPRG_20295 [Saprolegnia parasitica CBS 223.65]|uniref:Phosphoribosyltransferase domain-containing protein n=1 Tax=Saprolegnia parasitica (strain CBS 223.65) TaxID=695850 RepID=A0A067CG36_SAPPC|nr:hypothetical protein SPRG_20295 [Saprolegnia parasitica CBS 223.65]KDO28135.1 hypothetical protein SPRG_20295 [Saprolegnia parasitica CBS 223.65]|eukprot:XP_012201273.1 hypothetical protein SPRG_20295 [Saprolegnia parasitica CBS 223.65]
MTMAFSVASCQKERIYESGEVLGRGVKLELWKANHKNVEVLDLESETIQTGMTHLRDYASSGAKFMHCADKLIRNVLEAALTQLPNDEDAVVTTPLGYKAKGVDYEDNVKVCGIALCDDKLCTERLEHLLASTLPFDSTIGAIKLQDNAVATSSLPDDIEESFVVLLHPDFASFEKMQPVIKLLLKKGVEPDHIQVVSLVTCPAAADQFCKVFPDVNLVTASYDAASDSQGRIVPGIGNFEARYVGNDGPVSDEPPSVDPATEAASGSSSWWPFK